MPQQKTALITGAGAGIGKAIALRLAAEGYALGVNDIRAEHAQAVTEEITQSGGRCIALPADVADEAMVTDMVARFMATYGRIDLLVNNAGICPIRTLEQISFADFERSLRVNVSSMFLCTSVAAPHMKAQGGGRIINAASQSAFRQSAVTIEYTATKWAIRGLTRALAAALAPHNITVNAYCPGTVATEMHDAIDTAVSGMMGISLEAYQARQLAQIPLGRLQTPEDVAGLVAFLASDDAANITGQNILVNGGQVMC